MILRTINIASIFPSNTLSPSSVPSETHYMAYITGLPYPLASCLGERMKVFSKRSERGLERGTPLPPCSFAKGWLPLMAMGRNYWKSFPHSILSAFLVRWPLFSPQGLHMTKASRDMRLRVLQYILWFSYFLSTPL